MRTRMVKRLTLIGTGIAVLLVAGAAPATAATALVASR
jgi:hypothetical protein